MKALILTLERRLRRLPPLILMTLSLLYLVVVAAIDFACPSWMSFTLFYLIGAGLVGWFAANQRWGVTIAFATAVVLIIEEFARKGVPAGSWAATWNVITRLTAYFLVAWMALRLSRFTRTLGLLVEQQTSQWKSEAERHQATATRLAEALERFEQVITNISEVFWLSDVQKREVIYVSPAYEHIWGRPCGELYRDPKTWVEALHPADRETMVRQSLTTQAAGGYDAEYRIVRPDGT